MYGAVPPLQEMFNMAGMDLPEYLKGKDQSKPTNAIEDAEEVKDDEE
jgi:flotillin